MGPPAGPFTCKSGADRSFSTWNHSSSPSGPPVRRSRAMLIYSMSVSVDGFIADREGAFDWTPPGDELFGFHLAQVRELGGYLLGRRLYEAMLVWETDPSMRADDARS